MRRAYEIVGTTNSTVENNMIGTPNLEETARMKTMSRLGLSWLHRFVWLHSCGTTGTGVAGR